MKATIGFLLKLFIVIVFLRNGKIEKFPTATKALTDSDWFRPAKVLNVYRYYYFIASFPLEVIEHWEVR